MQQVCNTKVCRRTIKKVAWERSDCERASFVSSRRLMKPSIHHCNHNTIGGQTYPKLGLYSLKALLFHKLHTGYVVCGCAGQLQVCRYLKNLWVYCGSVGV
jgi:hypothetical protein